MSRARIRCWSRRGRRAMRRGVLLVMATISTAGSRRSLPTMRRNGSAFAMRLVCSPMSAGAPIPISGPSAVSNSHCMAIGWASRRPSGPCWLRRCMPISAAASDCARCGDTRRRGAAAPRDAMGPCHPPVPAPLGRRRGTVGRHRPVRAGRDDHPASRTRLCLPRGRNRKPPPAPARPDHGHGLFARLLGLVLIGGRSDFGGESLFVAPNPFGSSGCRAKSRQLSRTRDRVAFSTSVLDKLEPPLETNGGWQISAMARKRQFRPSPPPAPPLLRSEQCPASWGRRASRQGTPHRTGRQGRR